MDFSLSEEQQLFSDSLKRLLAESFPTEKRKVLVSEGVTHAPDLWQALAELGLLGLPVAEADGGFGGSMGDVAIASIELGRGTASEPFAASSVVAGGMVSELGSADQRAEILPAVVSGEMRLAAALLEPQARYDLCDLATIAEAGDAGFMLTGAKAVVVGGDYAHRFVVSARVGEDPHNGIGLFLVDASTAGVDVRGYPLADGSGAAEVTFSQVALPPEAALGAPDDAVAAMERAFDRGAVAICAEAVGALEAINELTLDYLRTRQQFGRPIGAFQALQHRMVDMVLEFEHAKSLVLAAAGTDGQDDMARQRAVSAAKAYIGEKGRMIATEAVQLHGGIGVTDEYRLGDLVKRVMVAEMLYGDTDHHLARFGSGLASGSVRGPGVWS